MTLHGLLASVAMLGLAACSPASDDVVVAPPSEQAVDTLTPQIVENIEAAPEAIIQDAPAPPAPTPVPALAPVNAEAVPLKYMMGDVKPGSDPVFAAVPGKLATKAGMYGHKDALAALAKMADAAAKDGVDLKVVSAFRSFNDQKRIWDNKWTGVTLVEGGKLPNTVPDPRKRALKILEFSSMPGTSRHHWGTDFDLNALNNSYFASGKGKAIHDWLKAHGAEYGFCQVYSPKGSDRPNGYNEERWHWSYLPVASVYLAQYPSVMGYDHLKGFEGAATAKDIDVIANYVQGISPACKT